MALGCCQLLLPALLEFCSPSNGQQTVNRRSTGGQQTVNITVNIPDFHNTFNRFAGPGLNKNRFVYNNNNDFGGGSQVFSSFPIGKPIEKGDVDRHVDRLLTVC